MALVRQWKLLERLASSPKGLTVKELVAASGMADRTVRRDLAFLKQIGFDVADTTAGYGVKLWPALLPLKREPFCAVIPRFLSL